MAEQILHGSNVVTAAEQGRRERVAEGVRCGGLRDACLFYGTFEGALKGLVIHVMATHDCGRKIKCHPNYRTLQRSNSCKNPFKTMTYFNSAICKRFVGMEAGIIKVSS